MRCRILAGAILGVLIARGAEPEPTFGASETQTSGEVAPGGADDALDLPPFLAGVDLALPAPEAFRSWPPREIAERPFWFPWSPAAFRKAQLFDRPVLLVLLASWNGPSRRFYREVLRDPEIASILNESYVVILVDADRRPDIRTRYQSATWPTLAWLLPDGLPMLSRANPREIDLPIRAGFVDVPTFAFLLREGRTYYGRQGPSLQEAAVSWMKGDPEEAGEEPGGVDAQASDAVAGWLLANHDAENGGFGIAPKFPVPGLVEYAMARAGRGEPDLLPIALFTLEKLLASPLHDRERGGVRRIALAPGWREVESEKLLEVNANFLRELSFAARARDSEEIRSAMRSTAKFLLGSLERPGGGFFLAEVAREEGAESSRSLPSRTVLSGPVALAGAALLRASAALSDPDLAAAGRRALDFVLGRGFVAGRGVEHILEPGSDGRRPLEAQAETAFALIDAYETTLDPRYRDAARDLVEFCGRNLLEGGTSKFRDRLSEPADVGILADERTPLRENALLARTMLRLEAHGLGGDFRERAAGVLGGFAGNLGEFGVHGAAGALAVEETIRRPLVVRIDGNPEEERAAALRNAALRLPWSWTIVGSGEKGKERTGASVEWLGEKRRVTGEADLVREVSRRTAAREENEKR